MKTNTTQHTSRFLRHLTAGALALGLTTTAFAQGTAFTYQGRLTEGVNPATGIYDLSFTLYDAAAGVGTVGSPVPKLGVGITNGLFTVALDFGAGLFNGSARWLEIAAKRRVHLCHAGPAPTAHAYALRSLCSQRRSGGLGQRGCARYRDRSRHRHRPSGALVERSAGCAAAAARHQRVREFGGGRHHHLGDTGNGGNQRGVGNFRQCRHDH